MTNKEINDFDPTTSLVGTEEFLLQETSGGTVKKVTADDIHSSKVGWANYDDTTTVTTPIMHSGSGGFIQLTNDATGPQTFESFLPASVTSLWNPTTNELDFSELEVGDMVDIRIDVVVTTTSPNQEVMIRLRLDTIGLDINLDIEDLVIKSAGTQSIVRTTGFFIGIAGIRDNPGQILVDSDNSLDIEVNGWYIRVIKR